MRAMLMFAALALAACSAEAPQKAEQETEAPASPASTQTPSAESALAALPTWDGARAAGVDFRAAGQEPGWILDIYQRDQIKLLWDYGENHAVFPLPTPTYPREGETRYETQAGGHALIVTTRRAPCEDVMGGEAYPATVDVSIDGRVLHGCGRTV